MNKFFLYYSMVCVLIAIDTITTPSLHAGPYWERIDKSCQKTEALVLEEIYNLLCAPHADDRMLGSFALAAHHFKSATIIQLLKHYQSTPATTSPVLFQSHWFCYVRYGVIPQHIQAYIENRFNYHHDFVTIPGIFHKEALKNKLRLISTRLDHYIYNAAKYNINTWEDDGSMVIADGKFVTIGFIPSDAQLKFIKEICHKMEADFAQNIPANAFRFSGQRSPEEEYKQDPETPPTRRAYELPTLVP